MLLQRSANLDACSPRCVRCRDPQSPAWNPGTRNHRQTVAASPHGGVPPCADADQQLAGDDAAKFATLLALVAEERRQVILRQHADAMSDPERYSFVAKRAAQQMEVPACRPVSRPASRPACRPAPIQATA